MSAVEESWLREARADVMRRDDAGAGCAAPDEQPRRPKPSFAFVQARKARLSSLATRDARMKGNVTLASAATARHETDRG